MATPLHLLANIYQQFFNAAGGPLAGGQLYSYAAGTSTPLATYTDSTGSTQNTNPTVLNSVGQASLWMPGSVGYKFVMKDSLGNVLWTVDNVFNGAAPGEIVAAQIANNTLTGTQIANGAIGTAQIATGGVQTANIGAGQVTGAKIATGTIEVANIDPTIDLTGLNNMIEVVVNNADDKFRVIPQYPWSAPIQLANPDVLPAGIGHGVAWSDDGRFLAVAHTTTPFFSAYERSGAAFTKLATPSILPGTIGNGVAWSPGGEFLAVAGGAAPYVSIYQRKGLNLIKIPDVSPIPGVSSSNGLSVAWSPNGEFLAVTVSNGSFVYIYQRNVASASLSGAAFTVSAANATAGAVYTDANSVPWTVLDTISSGLTLYCSGGSFMPAASGTLTKSTGTGDATITYSASTPLSQFGPPFFLKVSDPATLPPDSSLSCAWSPNGDFLAVAHFTTPGFSVYQRAGAVFTKISNPAKLPVVATGPGGVGCNSVAWSADGTLLAVGCMVAPYFLLYQLSGTTLTLVAAAATSFTVSSANATIGATYTDASTNVWTVLGTIAAGTNLYCSGSGTAPTSGVLTKTSGTGDATITFSVVLAVMASIPPGQVFGVAFSKNGIWLALAHANSPFLTIYSVSGTALTKQTDPITLPTGQGNGIAFSPTTQFLAEAVALTPFVNTYETASGVPNDGVLWVRNLKNV